MRDSVAEMIRAAGAELDSAKRLLGEAGEVAWDRLLDWLVDDYFRVVALGLENIPAEGPAVIAVNHSGAWGLDAFVLDKVLGRALDRRVRFLAAPFVFRTPILGRHARRNGALPIGPTAGVDHLDAGRLVGMYPEGVAGLEKPFTERYRLRPFNPGFAVAAIRSGAPVVPVGIVGAEEACPKLGEVPTLARLLGVPYFPLTTPFPLPSNWTITVGEAIPAPARPEGLVARREVARLLSETTRSAVQELVDRELANREHLFD
ncbi:lysophospholipid acyltransferase family protein [Streptomyces sp. NPDC059999]|uniref:lysophospholipid acyltransferase family protein n=1 Tax=Streptomyces sp. NPDC059999 TaxID=3347030 RepID=UPI003693A3DC